MPRPFPLQAPTPLPTPLPLRTRTLSQARTLSQPQTRLQAQPQSQAPSRLGAPVRARPGPARARRASTHRASARLPFFLRRFDGHPSAGHPFLGGSSGSRPFPRHLPAGHPGARRPAGGATVRAMLAAGALLAALALLPGCARLKAKFAPEPAGYVMPERPNDSCNSAPYRRYAGQPADALADLVFGGPVRWLQAGAAPGADYDPVRLNIEVDALGTVTRLWCG